MASPMPATRPPRIPMCQAFFEAVAIVRDGLDRNGIRWDPQSEQDAVSTLLIQAGKAGMLLPWNPPAPAKLPIPINRPSQTPPAARQGSEAPRPVVSEPPAARRGTGQINAKVGASEDAPAPAAASNPSFGVMLRAFREVEANLPPEVFQSVLNWYGAETPGDFRPEQVSQAAACYVALKMARDQYRVDQQITVEHFEQTEEGWR